ncbi:tautomerase family protein [Phytoactinopolyspora mesophila]|uniref:Tautomerase n=1 Tax=Phytoactinopolyspora mesophila TaxID=2650750 RepID=A0A7K3MCE7_9ACTN|nr:tautomerase [Phytoactinopolyspora mesophila]NDL60068.1 tautomerase [Phytoactinopolyspora mesophila]
MPSIQIDLPLSVTPSAKQALAQRFGAIYAETMQVSMDLLTVSVHDLGDGGVWRCHQSSPPTPSALIMCDIRRGRSVETKATLAQSLIDTLVEMCDLNSLWVKVEFTQHSGEDMFHPHLGGFNVEWSGDERVELGPATRT